MTATEANWFAARVNRAPLAPVAAPGSGATPVQAQAMKAKRPAKKTA